MTEPTDEALLARIEHLRESAKKTRSNAHYADSSKAFREDMKHADKMDDEADRLEKSSAN